MFLNLDCIMWQFQVQLRRQNQSELFLMLIQSNWLFGCLSYAEDRMFHLNSLKIRQDQGIGSFKDSHLCSLE
ncbi:unnamed protein product [Paramecium octaurelia]|uniref:Uncharacterized protein n=1 Tax=Paramecium octaurelia TaxID=43137 RepID=A0A8S1VWX0_PAROT|nr:unnamed protein product [Paramecium octaurelia]